ncbi:MAG: MerR family transcriptional regulator [Pseudomonadota bacterium]
MTNAYASQNFTDNDADESASSAPITAAKEKTQKSKKAPSAFRTISEVADELDVQQHVLRFWETKFSQVRPLKRGGGRRYYRPEDVALLKRIHHLLYTEGYTIKGVQKLLKGQGKSQILASANEQPREAPKTVPQELAAKPESRPESQNGMNDTQRELMQGMLEDLKGLRDILKGN